MKTIKLQLGDQERTLNFGVMGFLKYLGQILDADPLDIFSSGFATDPSKSYKINLAIIYAGVLAQCEVEKVKPTFTKDDVDSWVSTLDTSSVDGLIFYAYSALTGKTVDELKKIAAQAAEG